MFNFNCELLTESSTNDIFDLLETYKKEVNEKLDVTSNTAKKHILISDKDKGLAIKIKLQRMNLNDEDDLRMVMRFIKKSGTIYDFNDLMQELHVYLDEIKIEDENE